LIKVALIGDVHANLPALEVVVTHARSQGVDAIWNTGDLVGYGAFPDSVVRRLWHENSLSILGNYDLKVLKFKNKHQKWRKSKHPLKFQAFGWAYEQLTKKSRRYLRSLPREKRFESGGKRILLTHGSPVSSKEPLTPNTPEVRLRELAQIAQVDVILCGHSHQPFARDVDDVWFINPGSVGRPDDGDPRTGYAVIDLAADHLQIAHHRLEYDVKRAVTEIRERGLPEAFAQMTLHGHPLDQVIDE
jgi:putative phosphoesterase